MSGRSPRARGFTRAGVWSREPTRDVLTLERLRSPGRSRHICVPCARQESWLTRSELTFLSGLVPAPGAPAAAGADRQPTPETSGPRAAIARRWAACVGGQDEGMLGS